MDLIELARQKELSPKKTAATHGGEYHSACPVCGGKDRFTLWPNEQGRDNVKGRYWCRQCNITGDTLSFCIDILDMKFKDACALMRLPERELLRSQPFRSSHKIREYFISSMPPSNWQTAANAFLSRSEKSLEQALYAQELLQLRGLSLETIKQHRLGYNPKSEWIDRKLWGLPEEKVEGKAKKLWLPQGLVIPTLDHGLPIKLKIRRDEWHEEDKLPKYVELPGSKQAPSLFGLALLPIVLVEAELDALLIMQEASDVCLAMALGGVSKLPDQQTHEILKSADLILFALDFDDAGKFIP